jgi:flagellar motor switch protein FliN/FliY
MADPTPETAADIPSAADLVPPNAAAGAAVGAAESTKPLALPSELISDAEPFAGVAGSELDLSHLPAQTRGLLKIPVIVTVTLAQQRHPIREITELGPGTIVKFEKTYDEPLELTVGELPIASGEVVKVGDKFGLRIGRIIRPHERQASGK